MNAVCFVFFKGLRVNFLCGGENKNFQLDTLSVYGRPCEECAKFAPPPPPRQKTLGTALEFIYDRRIWAHDTLSARRSFYVTAGILILQ